MTSLLLPEFMVIFYRLILMNKKYNLRLAHELIIDPNEYIFADIM